MPSLDTARRLKVECLANGICISEAAREALTFGEHPLSVFEYPTTSGVTFFTQDDIYVNGPFHGVYQKTARAILDVSRKDGTFAVRWDDFEQTVEVMPLPGFLEARNSEGGRICSVVMSHADRARLSPISGCAFNCQFCDTNLMPYRVASKEEVLEGLAAALADSVLPARHVLISGGTPSPEDWPAIDETVEAVLRCCPLPVDVMLAPREDSLATVDKLVAWGTHGFAINLEIFDDDIARRLVPEKAELGRKTYARWIERAVELTGGRGRVRSLLLVGLEPMERTLEGVEWLARLGCDPVLSPFRPGSGTPLESHPVPDAALLTRLWLEASEVVSQYDVRLGPRCIPCQHNALAFPDGTDAYYFSCKADPDEQT